MIFLFAATLAVSIRESLGLRFDYGVVPESGTGSLARYREGGDLYGPVKQRAYERAGTP